MRLHGGGELAHEDAAVLGPEELDAIAQGPAHARWLLLECPFAGIDAAFLDAMPRLRARGYGLLLAHPERSAGLLHGGLDALLGRLGDGVALQVNASSLRGDHGLEAQAAAMALLRRRLVLALASDAHPGTREHTLQLGFDLLLRAGATTERAVRLTQEQPAPAARAGRAARRDRAAPARRLSGARRGISPRRPARSTPRRAARPRARCRSRRSACPARARGSRAISAGSGTATTSPGPASTSSSPSRKAARPATTT